MQNMYGNKQVLLFFSQLSQIDFCVEMGLSPHFLSILTLLLQLLRITAPQVSGNVVFTSSRDSEILKHHSHEASCFLFVSCC